MSEMLIKPYDYSTLWHVDVDSADELLGEFADEDEKAQDDVLDEADYDEEQDVAYLDNGVRYLHYSVDLHFSNNSPKKIYMVQKICQSLIKQKFSLIRLQVDSWELEWYLEWRIPHKPLTSQEFSINGQALELHCSRMARLPLWDLTAVKPVRSVRLC